MLTFMADYMVLSFKIEVINYFFVIIQVISYF